MAEKRGLSFRYLAFLGMVIGTFLLIRIYTQVSYTTLYSVETLAVDELPAGILSLDAACYSRYPNALYAPEDFAAGVVPLPEGNAADEVYDDVKTEVGTYRLVINLMPGEVYGLSGYSAAYAQRMWIDGRLVSEIGTPGLDEGSTLSRANYFTVYFEAKAPSTEIIWQRANFAHVDEGKLPPLFLGTQQAIGDMLIKAQTWTVVIVGVMLTGFLFYMGFFFFSERRTYFLWFALACLCIAARTFIREQKLIMVIFPELTFAAFHRLEYAFTTGFVVFLFLYIRRLFGIKGYATWVAIGLSVVYLMIVMLTPSLFYTQFLGYMQIGFLICAAVSLVPVLRSLFTADGRWHARYGMIVVGIIACMGLAVVDVVRHSYGGAVADLNLIQIGMLVFVMTNALALGLGYRMAESERDMAQMAAEQQRETSRMLEQLNDAKSDFLATISHEMKTPLTIMSGFAQVTQYKLDAGAGAEDVRRYLSTISDEAQRLSRLVIQLMNTAFQREAPLIIMPIRPEDVCGRLVLITEPIVSKHSNVITMEVAPQCPPVLANMDMLMQVLLNLLTNASRHTQADSIRLAAVQEGDMVRFSVEDHGTGMDLQALAGVFERGQSHDGSTGIGLSVCREIIEGFGGRIWMDSVPGVGTSVHFTLPIAGEDT